MSLFSKFKGLIAGAMATIGSFGLSGMRDSTVHPALPPTNADNWLARFVHQHRQVEYVWPRKSERSAEEVQELKRKAQARREARAYKRAENHSWAISEQPIDSTYYAMAGDYAKS